MPQSTQSAESTVKVGILLPRKLARDLKVAAAMAYISSSQYVADALRAKLRADELAKDLADGAVMLLDEQRAEVEEREKGAA